MNRGATADRGAVMVTGATGGIGSAIAARLARAGVRVSIFDLDSVPVESLVNSLNSGRPGSSVGCSGDASRRGDVETWLRVTVQAFGSVGGLVNVAGHFMSKPVLELQDQDVHEALAANLMTTIVCSQVVGEHMVQAQFGSIVNIASTAGEYGSISPAAHYAAAKGGVIAFTKSIAREFAPFGIRVNSVSPGPIDTTGRSSGSWEPDDKVAGRSLLQRMGRPDEVAEAVCFLLSEESSFITGHTLRVNGGALL